MPPGPAHVGVRVCGWVIEREGGLPRASIRVRKYVHSHTLYAEVRNDMSVWHRLAWTAVHLMRTRARPRPSLAQIASQARRPYRQCRTARAGRSQSLSVCAQHACTRKCTTHTRVRALAHTHTRARNKNTRTHMVVDELCVPKHSLCHGGARNDKQGARCPRLAALGSRSGSHEHHAEQDHTSITRREGGPWCATS